MDRGDWSQPWQDPEFCGRLSQTEAQHVQVQADHERARRELEMARRDAADDLMRLWISYRRILDELEFTTAVLESLRFEAYSALGVAQQPTPTPAAARHESPDTGVTLSITSDMPGSGVDSLPAVS